MNLVSFLNAVDGRESEWSLFHEQTMSSIQNIHSSATQSVHFSNQTLLTKHLCSLRGAYLDYLHQFHSSNYKILLSTFYSNNIIVFAIHPEGYIICSRSNMIMVGGNLVRFICKLASVIALHFYQFAAFLICFNYFFWIGISTSKNGWP